MDNNSLLLEHLKDLADRASKAATYSMFLSPAVLEQCPYIAKIKQCNHSCFGGYDGAERQIVAFYKEGEDLNFPISCLKLSQGFSEKLEHRQIMGSILALGLKRDILGDIVINNNYAYIFCIKNIAQHIIDNITKIGALGVSIEFCKEIPDIVKSSGLKKRFTVSSMRLDNVLSAALNLSRGKAQGLVAQGLVAVNHKEALKAEMRLDTGYIISVRYHGRMILLSQAALTKKGRIPIEIELFLRKK